ncbi:MAG: CPBP family intramembrane glutamic endopeptidase [Hyphomicrobium sp.]
MQADETNGFSRLLWGPNRYLAASPWGPFGALLITVVAIGAQLVVYLLPLAIGLIAGLDKANVDALTHDMGSLKTPIGAAAMVAAQLASFAVIWAAAGYRGARADVLRLGSPKPAWETAVLAGLAVSTATGLFELVLYLLFPYDLFADSRWLAEGLREPTGWAVALSALVLAPLWEEALFRGFLLSSLAQTRLGYWPAAVLSTTLWTLLHLGYSWPGMTSVFVAGIALSWLMQRTGSMRAVVVAHGVANAIAVAFALQFAPATA